ncbi:hypothetical protein V512_010745 [Mesotoga sp. Brook.08.105.5.1]|nr:hypothetical protein V512_010745 [Mesotoga sp. Brook.08.105.5.1]RAO98325.1 hypothetical protein M388_00400 [Mesotoga sp. Brook.08.YT.4.2.5.4.]
MRGIGIEKPVTFGGKSGLRRKAKIWVDEFN